MSIRLILTDNEITINEELKDNETIYNYINRAINNFDNKYNEYEFEDYYYNTKLNRFFMDTGVNYKELHTNITKNGLAFVYMVDIANNRVKVYYNKFKKMYNIIE